MTTEHTETEDTETEYTETIKTTFEVGDKEEIEPTLNEDRARTEERFLYDTEFRKAAQEGLKKWKESLEKESGLVLGPLSALSNSVYCLSDI